MGIKLSYKLLDSQWGKRKEVCRFYTDEQLETCKIVQNTGSRLKLVIIESFNM